MTSRGALGDFLVLHRSRLRPEAVGLQGGGHPRRVEGLRREELAQLAGVSSSYYTRLEQGQSLNASVEVLDGLARALRLSDDEHDYLHALARGARSVAPPERPAPEHAAPSTAQLVRALGGIPAVLTGRRGDVLLWNDAWHALFAGHLDPASPGRGPDRPNTARLVFLDPHTRELFVDWEAKARAVVQHLRRTAGTHPQDPLLAELIGELSMQSAEFAALWADHRVATCSSGRWELAHPTVGRLSVTQQTMAIVGDGDQLLSTFTSEPGSPTEDALRLLAGLRPGA